MSVRAIFALAVLIPATLVGMAVQAVLLAIRSPWARWLPVYYHRFVCKVIGLRRHVRGTPAALGTPVLVTANHSSWLDIPVISSLGPVSFIAKSEIAGWPVIGRLAKLQRSIFVSRERRAETVRINQAIAARLAEGDTIVLFAEGTAGDGNRIMPFRSALIGAARDALATSEDGRVLVQPLAIAYTRIQGTVMGRYSRPRVAWYANMNLPRHLMGVLSLGAIDVEVIWGEPVPLGPQDDRKAVTRLLETRVRAAFTEAILGRPEAPPHRAAPDVTNPPSLPAYLEDGAKKPA